jgi:hypothetical protein
MQINSYTEVSIVALDVARVSLTLGCRVSTHRRSTVASELDGGLLRDIG